ncbi:MAG: peptidase U32 family protein, partial [Blautia faecis]
MNQNNIELLAPAGSYEGFEAALGAGADAVYVGGTMFGARAYAQNFNEEELLRAIDVAHIHGRKLYLTVNTLLKNKELNEHLVSYLEPYYNAGLDAVIVQDMGVFSLLKREFPKLHLHASTQMTVTGPEGMKFLAEQGATRVVAARELSLQELSRMHEACPIEIEAFVHGALCYSYSGQCLMSSLLGGRSGNRGRCAQPCRLPYQVKNFRAKEYGKGEFCPLSLKDICTIEILPEIIEAGVTSLKIEGRMKQPAYTAGVTGMYRKYLDFLFEKGPANYHVTEKDKKYLLDLFNRGGSCTGYYQMGNGPQMMAFTNEKKTGEVFLETKQLKEKITGELHLVPGSPVLLHVSCQGEDAYECVGEVQYAKSQPVTEERVRQQMDKLGNTSFIWEKLEIYMEDSVFVPMKTLNEARHQALENLKEKLLRKYRRNVGDERVKRIAEETPAKIRDVVIHDNVPRNKEEYIPV